ncbi:hypothetical protein J3Q64DRAFT_1697802 [Phycomyces blakesleeanus]|uniref:Uncharacterized protein n=1 Tax=Phycomyces blakesleeanus TaxID=4837 RepID=A0ABR3B0G1_PHYBL
MAKNLDTYDFSFCHSALSQLTVSRYWFWERSYYIEEAEHDSRVRLDLANDQYMMIISYLDRSLCKETIIIMILIMLSNLTLAFNMSHMLLIFNKKSNSYFGDQANNFSKIKRSLKIKFYA